jgi:1,4-alpha-glucan branching enzyme
MREQSAPLPGGGAGLGDHPEEAANAATAAGGGTKSVTGPAGPQAVGDLAIVLHSHMPYVEGFGTYPFGEEWLFDAVIRSYLPVLEVARDLTMTVTPVLADQLEDAGAAERLRRFLVDWRIGAAKADAPQVPAECREACEAELARYRHALELLDAAGGDPLGPFQDAAAEGRIALAGSAATHAVLPLLATRAGLRLQLDAGIRSHRRRFGWDGGFWLPECAYVPGLEHRLAEHGVRWFCVDQSAHLADPLEALMPVGTSAGPIALPIDWEAIQWLWSLDGYPADPAHAQFAGKSLRGVRIWKVGGGAYDPAVAEAAARRQAAEFLAAVAARLREFATRHHRRGLLVFAIDTELLGHWWSEGATWLHEVLAGAAVAGVRLVTVPQALAEHEPVERPLAASTWGEHKDLSTWDSPEVADLAWGARRLELRLLRELGRGLRGPAAQRAARELLAVQASDWAFLDKRSQAGDYPFRRVTDHSHALLEAIDSPTVTDPCMRSLAPDLSLAPLLEP